MMGVIVQGSRFVVKRVFMMSGVSVVVCVSRPGISKIVGNLSPVAVNGSLVLVIVRSDVVGGDMVGHSLVDVVRVVVRV